ncbi:MAG: lipopolysaccharide biosynthesis protein [Nocardioidaceae bacterium]
MTSPEQVLLPGEGPGNGAARPASALVWSFLNTAVSRLGTVAIGVVLARVLGPEEFGTYAVAFIALMAVLSFNELGVSLAIVRWPEDPRTIAPTVTTISLIGSAIVTLAVFVGAGPFASAMGDPGATNLVRVLGLCVIINGAVAAPAALLQRYFRQDRRMIADQVNVWLGAVISVSFVLGGLGAWGLVIGRLVGAAVSGVLLIRFSPEPFRLGLNREHVRPLLAFGLPLAGASVIVFAVAYVDQLVVGPALGSLALGYYVLAFNLANWPVSMLSQPLRSVAPALFARLQHDPPLMHEAFRRTLRPLAAVAIPSCVVIAVASNDVVRFVYGSEWLPAAPVLRWLALLAAFRILFELAYDYLVVLRKSSSLMSVQVLWLVFLLPAVYVGARVAETSGVAAAQVIVAGLVVLPAYLYLLHSAGVGARDLVERLWPALIPTLALSVGGWLISSWATSAAWALAATGLLTMCSIAFLLRRCRGDLGALRTMGNM